MLSEVQNTLWNKLLLQEYSNMMQSTITEILDKVEQKFNIKIKRDYDTGTTYIVQGYCKENNTTYEVFYNSSMVGFVRQQQIQSAFKCNYCRIFLNNKTSTIMLMVTTKYASDISEYDALDLNT